MNTILNKRTIFVSLFSLLMLLGYAEREKVVQIFRGGEVVQEYAISEIDYIEVNDRIESPSKVEAEVDEKSITITWNAVEGATYNVYRSADNVNFTLLAKDLKENAYTDSEPLSGSNLYKVKAIVDGHESAYTQSAAASFPGDDPGKDSAGWINGHEYVDLGLPSGLKWATCNVGADSPAEYGNYYAWGEISTKSSYTESNSKTYEKSMNDISGDPVYDAARANWGGTWRLPTRAELLELRLKCRWTWTKEGNHNGYRATGPNGKSIFLPAAGYAFDSWFVDEGYYGYYSSSSPYENNTIDAYELYFDNSAVRISYIDYRYHGLPVRPVSE